jgi:endo-1,4-beta-xylanase
MKRRKLIQLIQGTVIGSTFSYGSGCRKANSVTTQLDESDLGIYPVDISMPLRHIAAERGLFYGSAAHHNHILNDVDYAEKIKEQSEVIVPESSLKWKALRPSANDFSFDKADQLLEFALSHNMRMRGHTLVWHNHLPEWFLSEVNEQNAEKFLIEHIETVVSRYSGKIFSWDVVNEAIHPNPRRFGEPWRNTPWLRFLGPKYIELAFRTAAVSDPSALLVYNDYGLEHDVAKCDIKRSITLNLLKDLMEKGVPIHALGIQAHLMRDVQEYPVTFSRIREFLNNVADMGLKIIITEMDVTDRNLPADPLIRDKYVADIYKTFLATVLDETAVMGLITWGLSDRYTWLTKKGERTDGRSVRPLLLDSELQLKPAWHAASYALGNAPQR